MKARAIVTVMYKSELPDPNGEALKASLRGAGFDEVENVRTGKEITVEFEVRTRKAAQKAVNEMCKKLLAHPFSETYLYTIEYQKTPRRRRVGISKASI